MYKKLRFLFINTFTNLILLMLIFLVAQNNNLRSSVNFFSMKSAEIPIGVITGLSFLSGSFLGGSLLIISKGQMDNKLSS